MKDNSPHSTLHALRTHLAQAGGPQFAGTAGTYAMKSFIDDLHSEINREIDAMMAPRPKTDQRAISVLVADEKTAAISKVTMFPFSPEGMAEAVSLSCEIAAIGPPTIPVIECLGTDSLWHVDDKDLQFMMHFLGAKAFPAYVAEYLAEREPS